MTRIEELATMVSELLNGDGADAALDELVSLLQEATEIMRYATMNVASGDHAADIETLTADFLVKIGQD